MHAGSFQFVSRFAALVATVATVFILGGCTPKVLVNVGDGTDSVLREQVVYRDRGSSHNRIAQIDVRGLIVDGRSSGLLGSGPNPVDIFIQRLDLAASDSRVKAVILRINSPGGTVAASESMLRELDRFKAKTGKPVIVSMGEVAASGGYYLALGGDTIIAQETSVTGSIGVIFPTINVSEGLAHIGVVSRAVKSGPNKDLANPLEPMRESQYVVVQEIVDDFYGRFVTLVRTRRAGLTDGNASIATDGRVVTGSRALELGLIDATGSVRDAFEEAKKRARIGAATWVKYRNEDATPGSVYAKALATDPTSDLIAKAAAYVGVVPSGFYYLWQPGVGSGVNTYTE